jgi:hypothetical protein
MPNQLREQAVRMNGHMQHIRDRYGVPAYRGRRIRFQGAAEGVIVSARNDYLRVRFKEGTIAKLHPTWEVEYLPPASESPTAVPLLTEAAGPVRCRDCGTWIERGEPCVDMDDGTGDVLCQTCGDEAGLVL